MKKLPIVCLLVTMFGAGTVHAQQYEVAPCGTKDFTTTVGVVPGGTVCFNIWLTDANAPQFDGGAWLDFTGSTADIAYVSAGRALWDGSEGPTGPWDPFAGFFLNEAGGVGTVMYVVTAGAAPPDGDGDIIVGTITLQNTGPNDATVNITTVPDVATWTPIVDSNVNANTVNPVLTIITDLDGDGVADDEDNCPKTPNPNQEDTYPPQGNDIGDACDCEADFDCDGNVDADDARAFITDFGRHPFCCPCTFENPCSGDFNCDKMVAADDVRKFLEDFGRSQFNNPCPPCVVGVWCVYP